MGSDPLHPLFKRLGFHTLWHRHQSDRGHLFIVGRPTEETTAKGAGVKDITLERGTLPHAELGSKLVNARTHTSDRPNQMRHAVRHSRN